MTSAKRIDRKLFLTFTLTSTASLALGCSSDPSPSPFGPSPQGGAAGANSGGAGGGAGAPSAGAGGSPAGGAGGGGAGGGAGTSGGGGASGSAGSGGAAGASGSAGSAGAAGSAAGAGGATVTPDCGTKLKTLITANHGHVFTVSAADVMAGVAKAYDTKGTATHTHWIQLTADDMTKLKAGGTVRKASCNDGHEHEYIVNCVNVAAPTPTSGISQYCDGGHTCGDMNNNFCPVIP